jgi:hypothetical protein
MPENDNSEERAQIERAKRLRAHIARLKAGGEEPPTATPKSIKEQVRERSRKKKPVAPR